MCLILEPSSSFSTAPAVLDVSNDPLFQRTPFFILFPTPQSQNSPRALWLQPNIGDNWRMVKNWLKLSFKMYLKIQRVKIIVKWRMKVFKYRKIEPKMMGSKGRYHGKKLTSIQYNKHWFKHFVTELQLPIHLRRGSVTKW